MKLQGPRENCEDITCIECNKYLANKNYAEYRNCKRNCFIEKGKEITECCARSCEGLPESGKASCLDACATSMNL
jgi:hypothetical protein